MLRYLSDTLAEKRRRRRESHNAVERRRRDTINEKISELSTLLPTCMLDPVRTLPYSAQELAADLCALTVDLSFASTVPTAEDAIDDDDEPMMVSVEDEVKGGKAAAAGKGKGKKVGPKKKTGGGGGLNAIGPDGKPNKGIVLKKSVEYIRCVASARLMASWACALTAGLLLAQAPAPNHPGPGRAECRPREYAPIGAPDPVAAVLGLAAVRLSLGRLGLAVQRLRALADVLRLPHAT
jgi:hypothetical protein